MLKKPLLLMIMVLFLTACSSDVTNKIGDIGYDFEMENFQGETLKIGDFKGNILYVLAWSST